MAPRELQQEHHHQSPTSCGGKMDHNDDAISSDHEISSKQHLQHQQQDQEDSTTRNPRSSSTSTNSALIMSHPLSAFLHVLLEENAPLADAEIVVDRAAILPDKHSKSCILLEAHSSSVTSMPELSRWDSHIVRTPPPAVLERERDRLEKEQKAAFHASPTRPQRRTSFEVDRSNDKLICAPDENTRKTLSQSLTQLSALQEDDVQELQQLCKKTLPPRVPIRRSSGRVQSPPPPESSSRNHHHYHPFLASSSNNRRQFHHQVDDDLDDGDDQDGSFQLQFSGSDHIEHEGLTHSRRAQHHHHHQDALSSSVSSTNSSEDDTTPRRPASYEDRVLRSSLTTPTTARATRRSRSPKQPNNNKNNDDSTSNHARHRRTSLGAGGNPLDGLPQLEGFSSQPHQRVLPRQEGTRHLAGGGMLPPPVMKDDDNTPNHDGEDMELNLTKVASSKVLPSRRSFDLGEKVRTNIGSASSTNTGGGSGSAELSPPTVQKAVKKTLLGRMKKTVKGKLMIPRGRSKSPVQRRQRSITSGSGSGSGTGGDGASKSPVRRNSGETHSTYSTNGSSSV